MGKLKKLMSVKEKQKKYISLSEASKLCKYSQDYLSLRARQGKLKAVKKGRNWVTTKECLDEYVRKGVAVVEYITLAEAAKLCSYSQDYLSLRARQKKLKALKKDRNWFTTKQWIEEYIRKHAPVEITVKEPVREFVKKPLPKRVVLEKQVIPEKKISLSQLIRKTLLSVCYISDFISSLVISFYKKIIKKIIVKLRGFTAVISSCFALLRGAFRSAVKQVLIHAFKTKFIASAFTSKVLRMEVRRWLREITIAPRLLFRAFINQYSAVALFIGIIIYILLIASFTSAIKGELTYQKINNLTEYTLIELGKGTIVAFDLISEKSVKAAVKTQQIVFKIDSFSRHKISFLQNNFRQLSLVLRKGGKEVGVHLKQGIGHATQRLSQQIKYSALKFVNLTPKLAKELFGVVVEAPRLALERIGLFKTSFMMTSTYFIDTYRAGLKVVGLAYQRAPENIAPEDIAVVWQKTEEANKTTKRKLNSGVYLAFSKAPHKITFLTRQASSGIQKAIYALTEWSQALKISFSMSAQKIINKLVLLPGQLQNKYNNLSYWLAEKGMFLAQEVGYVFEEGPDIISFQCIHLADLFRQQASLLEGKYDNFVLNYKAGLEIIGQSFINAPQNIANSWQAMEFKNERVKSLVRFGIAKIWDKSRYVMQKQYGEPLHLVLLETQSKIKSGFSGLVTEAGWWNNKFYYLFKLFKRTVYVMKFEFKDSIVVLKVQTNSMLRANSMLRVVLAKTSSGAYTLVFRTTSGIYSLISETQQKITFLAGQTSSGIRSVAASLQMAVGKLPERLVDSLREARLAITAVFDSIHIGWQYVYGWLEDAITKLTIGFTRYLKVTVEFLQSPKKAEEIVDVKVAKKPTKEGIIVVPSTDRDEEVKQKIRDSFSDEVKIEIQDETSGIITPIFRKGDGDRYLYMMVPLSEQN